MKSTDFLNMPTDSIRAALERLLQVVKPEYNETDEIIAVVQAIAAARDALAAADAGGGEALLAAPAAEEEGDAWERTKERAWDMYKTVGYQGEQALDDRGFDRAADLIRDEITLIRRVPAPADGEVGELVKWLLQRCQLMSEAPGSEFHLFTRAATLLQQQAAELAALRTGVVPVPVSERPWEREGWCDKQGRCWFLSSRFLTWSLASPPVALTCQIARLHSLPFHAIPLPAPQGGEVV